MRFADFLKRKKIVVMVAYGGVGEFLFQLDLAKRLEKEGFSSIFLVKGKYTFFREIVQSSDLEATALLNAKGYRYFLFFPAIWLLSLMKDVTIINSFNSLFYRLPTRLFYSVANILGARVIVCKHERDQSLSYEQVTYKEDEMIWQRNSRIVRLLGRSAEKAGFPVLRFATTSPKEEAYIHIHPVGSSLRKSYPPKKLIRLLEKLHDKKIVLTLTPREKVWYLTRDIKDFLESKENITLKIKYFSFKEIAGLIANSEVFCTVNTPNPKLPPAQRTSDF